MYLVANRVWLIRGLSAAMLKNLSQSPDEAIQEGQDVAIAVSRFPLEKNNSSQEGWCRFEE